MPFTQYLHTASQTNAFHTMQHRADILAVVAAPDGESVFASGVDPAVVQFRHTQVCACVCAYCVCDFVWMCVCVSACQYGCVRACRREVASGVDPAVVQFKHTQVSACVRVVCVCLCICLLRVFCV